MRIRSGRGFTLEELKAAGVQKKQALTIGIPVDHRRRNRSEESLERNVQRLKAYKDRLILFPLKSKKPKKGDSSVRYKIRALSLGSSSLFWAQAEDLKANTTRSVSAAMPLPASSTPEEPRKITQEERDFDAYTTLRKARSDARFVGVRKIRAQKKIEEEEAKVEIVVIVMLSAEIAVIVLVYSSPISEIGFIFITI